MKGLDSYWPSALMNHDGRLLLNSLLAMSEWLHHRKALILFRVHHFAMVARPDVLRSRERPHRHPLGGG